MSMWKITLENICKVIFISLTILASVIIVVKHYIPINRNDIESFVHDFTGEVLAASNNLGNGFTDLYPYMLDDQYNDYPLDWGVNGAYAFINCFSLLQHEGITVDSNFEVFNFSIDRINPFELKITYGCTYKINNTLLSELFQVTLVNKKGLKVREFRVINYDNASDYKHDKMQGL